MKTPSLLLVLDSPEDVREMIGKMTPEEQAQLSDDWLALVESAETSDPWIHGFSLLRNTDHTGVGSCGLKGPPTPDGVVEIAYGIGPDYQGKGYATEAAQALLTYALSQSEVCCVRAHTLPEENASTRVLTKCGFVKMGECVDPEDGLVWRWEVRASSGQALGE